MCVHGLDSFSGILKCICADTHTPTGVCVFCRVVYFIYMMFRPFGRLVIIHKSGFLSAESQNFPKQNMSEPMWCFLIDDVITDKQCCLMSWRSKFKKDHVYILTFLLFSLISSPPPPLHLVSPLCCSSLLSSVLSCSAGCFLFLTWRLQRAVARNSALSDALSILWRERKEDTLWTSHQELQ